MESQRFMHIPLYVEGVRVTDDNMTEVAEWCGGKIEELPFKGRVQPFIRVSVFRPLSLRQTQAFSGDWVLKGDNGFRVYTNFAREKAFVLAEKVTDALAVKVSHELFVEPERKKTVTQEILEAASKA